MGPGKAKELAEVTSLGNVAPGIETRIIDYRTAVLNHWAELPPTRCYKTNNPKGGLRFLSNISSFVHSDPVCAYVCLM